MRIEYVYSDEYKLKLKEIKDILFKYERHKIKRLEKRHLSQKEIKSIIAGDDNIAFMVSEMSKLRQAYIPTIIYHLNEPLGN